MGITLRYTPVVLDKMNGKEVLRLMGQNTWEYISSVIVGITKNLSGKKQQEKRV